MRIKLNDSDHRFSVGNRIRNAISTSYWPVLVGNPVRLASIWANRMMLIPMVDASMGLFVVQTLSWLRSAQCGCVSSNVPSLARTSEHDPPNRNMLD